MAPHRQPGPLGTTPPGSLNAGTQRGVVPGPIGLTRNRGTIEWIIESIESAKTWETIDHYAAYLIGPESFGIGVLAGVVGGLEDTVVELMDLLITFVLADIYDQAQRDSGWSRWIDPDYLAALAADRFFHDALLERHRKRDVFLAEIKFAVLNPWIFAKGVGHDYVQKYHRFEAAFHRGTVTGLYEAGKILGGVILDILALIGVAEGAVKLAAKLPELAKIAESLRGPLRFKRIVAEGGGSADDASALRDATAGRDPAPGEATEPGAESDNSESQVTQNKRDGLRREQETEQELIRDNPDASVQREQYLRNEDGSIAKDPVTGTGRRLDHVVIEDGKPVDAVETTSMDASKADQIAKEARIREAGGTFIRDRTSRALIDFSDVPTREIRRP